VNLPPSPKQICDVVPRNYEPWVWDLSSAAEVKPDAAVESCFTVTGKEIGLTGRESPPQLGISEPVARLIRLIAAGVDVETIAHTGASRRAAASKPAKSSKPGHSKTKSRGPAR